MSSLPVTRTVIACDGCNTQLGNDPLAGDPDYAYPILWTGRYAAAESAADFGWEIQPATHMGADMCTACICKRDGHAGGGVSLDFLDEPYRLCARCGIYLVVLEKVAPETRRG